MPAIVQSSGARFSFLGGISLFPAPDTEEPEIVAVVVVLVSNDVDRDVVMVDAAAGCVVSAGL